jgi:hypothetical protein
MQRITKNDLTVRLAYLNSLLVSVGAAECTIGRAYNGLRLESHAGARNVQPRRGTARECYEFMGGVIKGLEAARGLAGHGWGTLG